MTKPTPLKDTNLFKPIELSNNVKLSHRVVLAPLTRFRNDPSTGVPDVELMGEYYRQRSSKPGSLVITEGITVEPLGHLAFDGISGIQTSDQIKAWSKIFQAIHESKSYVIAQLYSCGRQAHAKSLSRSDSIDFVAPSPIYIKQNPDFDFEGEARQYNKPLRALTTEEVEQYVKHFIQASKNAIEAGADGVQIHGANGYLIHEFIDHRSNQRTDKYGGSIENRSRFLLEIIDGLSHSIGLDKVSVRLSPYNKYGDLLGISEDSSLVDQYKHIVKELEDRAEKGQRLQFLDLLEPRYVHYTEVDTQEGVKGSNKFILDIWKGIVVKAGNFGHFQDAIVDEVQDERVLISIGRYYLSNPDLPDRLANGWGLNPYDRDTFYTPGSKGYTDYSFYEHKQEN